ncbi:group II intron maturase-specific domain-containing protein [Microcoleus sp. LAD1_D5]
MLIKKINPIIRGWCKYFSTVVSQRVFDRLKNLVF